MLELATVQESVSLVQTWLYLCTVLIPVEGLHIFLQICFGSGWYYLTVFPYISWMLCYHCVSSYR